MTREVITAIVSVVGLCLAIKGYNTWRRQILGRTEHDVARNVLFGALKVREELRNVRKPGAVLAPAAETDAGDGDGDHDDVDDPGERERRAVLKRMAAVYTERLERLRERLVELELAALEAEALWGEKAKACTTELVDSVHEVRAAVWEYFWLNGLYAPLEEVDRDRERVARNWAIMWDKSARSGDRKDEFAQRIENAVAKVVEFYRPKLQLRRD